MSILRRYPLTIHEECWGDDRLIFDLADVDSDDRSSMVNRAEVCTETLELGQFSYANPR